MRALIFVVSIIAILFFSIAIDDVFLCSIFIGIALMLLFGLLRKL
jgi:hypothetical protein